MNKNIFFLLLIFTSSPCYAYIGPGMAGGVIIAVIGFVAAIFLIFFGILYYPIKRFFKKRKDKKNSSLN